MISKKPTNFAVSSHFRQARRRPTKIGIAMGMTSTALFAATAGIVLNAHADTTFTPSGINAQQAAEIVKTCQNGRSKCSFEAEKVAYWVANKQPVGDSVVNCGPTDVKKTIGYNETVSETTGLGFSMPVGGQLGLAVSAGFETTFSHEWSESYTKDFAVEHTIPGWHIGYMERGVAMQGTTGTVVTDLRPAMYGHYQWRIPGATFNTEDTQGRDLDIVHTDPMSPAQRRQYCGPAAAQLNVGNLAPSTTTVISQGSGGAAPIWPGFTGGASVDDAAVGGADQPADSGGQ